MEDKRREDNSSLWLCLYSWCDEAHASDRGFESLLFCSVPVPVPVLACAVCSALFELFEESSGFLFGSLPNYIYYFH